MTGLDPQAPAALGGEVDPACAAVVERLAATFRSLPTDLVRAVVSQAAHELHGQVTPGARTELLHQLARCRLRELSRAGGDRCDDC